MAHECTQGSAPNLGLDLCFFFCNGQSSQQGHSDKKAMCRAFGLPPKLAPQRLSETHCRHFGRNTPPVFWSLSGTLAASSLNAGRPRGIINKARGMATSAPGATGYPRGSQQRAGAAPGAPHEPNIVAPAHTADKATHRIPDGPDTSFHEPPRRHGFAQHSREHGHVRQVPTGESAFPVDVHHPSEPRIQKVMDRGSATNI